MPRVDCPRCGVVVASVPWAEPGSRFTRDFEAECAWLMTVANQKTVSGFLHVSWRTAGTVARRVAERVKASMPSPFDGLHAIGVDETSHRKGHTYITVVVDHERHRVIWAHDGVGGDVFDLFFNVFCQVGVGRFGVSFSPCERRVSGRFGVGRSCWLLVIALVIA